MSRLLLYAQIIAEGSPTVITVDCPVVVITNIQGDLKGLREWLKNVDGLDIYLDPHRQTAPEKGLLFLGNIVGRGNKSIDTLLLVLCLYVRFPSRVYLLQGMHEDEQMCKIYGFFQLCRSELPNYLEYYRGTCKLFGYLPLVAIVGKISCTHAGIIPEGIPRQTDREQIQGMLAGQLNLSLNGWDTNQCGISYDFGLPPLISWLKKLGCIGFVNTGGDIKTGFTTDLAGQPENSAIKLPHFYCSVRSSTIYLDKDAGGIAVLEINFDQKTNVATLKLIHSTYGSANKPTIKEFKVITAN